MAILNYTTIISANKTAGEVQQALAKFGASRVAMEYDDNGQPSGVSFVLMIDRNGNNFPVEFKLPANVEGVLQHVKGENKLPARLRNREQATRVTWRILKDWIEAQLAIIEAEVAEPAQVLLPYAVAANGQTMYELFDANPQNLLGPAEPTEEKK